MTKKITFEKCPVCEGTEYVTCTKCNGTGRGEMKHAQDPDKIYKCIPCGGSGRVRCEHCGGNGKIKVEVEEE